MKDLVLKLIPEYMGGEIEKACAGIFPMQNVFVRKVKVLKKPKFDLVKLMELHSGEGAEDSGDKAEGDAEEVVAAEKDITQAASGPARLVKDGGVARETKSGVLRVLDACI